MSGFFFTILYQPLYNLLVWFYDVIPGGGLGLAIILLTVLVKGAVLPLSFKSLKAQKEMQEIQPKIQQIKEQYKDDKEKLAQEMMSVYKTHNVNPFASCLPTVVQLVIFIILYRVLQAGIHTIDASILYDFVSNPGQMSTHFLGMDLAAVSYPLAVLAAILQYFQAKQMITRRPPAAVRENAAALDEDVTATMNKTMVFVLPVMTLLIGIFVVPGGLSLYILVSSIITFVMQRYFLGKKKSA